jgi:hypothetical protein
MMKFKTWKLFKEGKNADQSRNQEVNDFLSGKTNRVKLSNLPASIGHQAHISGTGAHDSRPARQRTRQGQKQAWRKDYE